MKHQVLENLKALNKFELLRQKEIELLALIYNDLNNLIEILGAIEITLISSYNREVFKALFDLRSNETDQTEIFHILNRFFSGKEIAVILETALYVTNPGKRIKEFYDIVDSIKIDRILKEFFDNSQSNLKGLDLLHDLREKVDVELNKYKRFEPTKTFNECFPKIVERLEESTIKGATIKTDSFPSFNQITGGLSPGNLVGIAGAYKMGKTTFGINLILDLAKKVPSAIFSLEMSKEEIEDKILSHKLGIMSRHLRNIDELTECERKKIADYYKIANNTPDNLVLLDRMMTIKEIEREIINLKREHNIQAVMIDYIGLIKTSGYYETRERELTDYSRLLKTIAKEQKIIIILLAQLNRQGTKEALSVNLAESLGLARDCDFLFTVSIPFKMRITKIMINDTTEYIPTENDFLIKLTDTRHTENAFPFILRIDNANRLNELDVLHNNKSQNTDYHFVI